MKKKNLHQNFSGSHSKLVCVGEVQTQWNDFQQVSMKHIWISWNAFLDQLEAELPKYTWLVRRFPPQFMTIQRNLGTHNNVFLRKTWRQKMCQWWKKKMEVGKKMSFHIFELCAMNKNQPSLTYVSDEKLSGRMNSDREIRCWEKKGVAWIMCLGL